MQRGLGIYSLIYEMLLEEFLKARCVDFLAAHWSDEFANHA
jgi:hypothetical protein